LNLALSLQIARLTNTDENVIAQACISNIWS